MISRINHNGRKPRIQIKTFWSDNLLSWVVWVESVATDDGQVFISVSLISNYRGQPTIKTLKKTESYILGLCQFIVRLYKAFMLSWFHHEYILNCKSNAPCWTCIVSGCKDNFKILYIQIIIIILFFFIKIIFTAILSGLIVMRFFFLEKWLKRNFGAYCFLYSCFSTNFSLLVTCMMH